MGVGGGSHSGNTQRTPRQPAGVIALASSLTFRGVTASCYVAARHAYFHAGINATALQLFTRALEYTMRLVHSEQTTQFSCVLPFELCLGWAQTACVCVNIHEPCCSCSHDQHCVPDDIKAVVQTNPKLLT